MKKAAIISIGNEILSGRTADTNAGYLSRALLSKGIPAASFRAVGDDVDAIVRALKQAAAEAEVVVTTGGLGPTDDDLTRQGLAAFLGSELEFREDLLAVIRDFFAGRGLEMPEKNRVQAYVPAGSQPLANRRGTACGIMARAEGKLIAALPGVPAEMEAMFAESVLPELDEFASGQTVVVRKLRCYGAGESTIAGLLGPLMDRTRNPLINCTAEFGSVTLEIVATAQTPERAKRMARRSEDRVRALLGELIYGRDEQTLAEVVGELLARRGMTLAVAESCTGGLLSKLITDVPGASRYYTHGWVTYSNSAKTAELGVPEGLIARHGAVSEEVAAAMAGSARRKAGADVGVGITGIAGPGGTTEQKPAGLVYICIDSAQGSELKRCRLSGDRESVRLRAAQTTLNMLRLRFRD